MAEPNKLYPGECQNPRCTREDGVCIGYHCPRCGKPTTSMGHPECLPPASPTSQTEKNLQDAVTALWRRINAGLAILDEPIPHLTRTDPGLMGMNARREQEQLRLRVRAALQGDQPREVKRCADCAGDPDGPCPLCAVALYGVAGARAFLDMRAERDQARAQRNEAMENGVRHRENHGACDEAVERLQGERDQARTVASVLRCRIDDAVSWLDEPDDASPAVQLAKIDAALRGPR